jgi:hypothetical protein
LRKREGEREGEKERRRCPELLFLFLMGALAPFSYLVSNTTKENFHQNFVFQ